MGLLTGSTGCRGSPQTSSVSGAHGMFFFYFGSSLGVFWKDKNFASGLNCKKTKRKKFNSLKLFANGGWIRNHIITGVHSVKKQIMQIQLSKCMSCSQICVVLPFTSISRLDSLLSSAQRALQKTDRVLKQSKHSAESVCVFVCRQEFCSEACPDLTKEVYLQDIHCVGSLCKLYFRELPNPLLTYELYSTFTVSTINSICSFDKDEESPVCLWSGWTKYLFASQTLVGYWHHWSVFTSHGLSVYLCQPHFPPLA